MLQNNDEPVEYTLTITSTEEFRIKAAMSALDMAGALSDIKGYLRDRDKYRDEDLQSIEEIRSDIVEIINNRVDLDHLGY